MNRYRRLLRLVMGRESRREAIDDEIRTHIELRTDELIASGMDPTEARREAERRFGDLAAARERLYSSARVRDEQLRWRGLLDQSLRDIVLAARTARRSPGFSLTAILIFALGISLSTAMFTLVDGVLLRPLPFPSADRLMALRSVAEDGTVVETVSMANWYDWRAGATNLDATGLYAVDRMTLAIEDGREARRIEAASVTGGFFEALRPTMAAGRYFTAEEADDDTDAVVIGPTVAEAGVNVGSTIRINGRVREVVGVVSAQSVFPEAEIWIPHPAWAGSGGMRNNINYWAVARIGETANQGLVRSELDGIARSIRESDPEGIYSWGVDVTPLRQVVTADIDNELRLLLSAVLLLLAVACANLAGLSLSRGRGRSREFAVRRALGAGRARLTRQLLVEHLALSLVGGALGLVFLWSAGEVLLSRVGATIPRAGEIQMDYRIALGAFVISLVAGVAAGILPALRGANAPPGVTLGSARGEARGGRGLPGAPLVIAEVALALVLLVGGGLLVRSLESLTARDLGFEAQGVLTADIALTSPEYSDSQLAVAYWERLAASLGEQPSIRIAAAANAIPTGGGGTSFIAFPDDPEPDFGAGYRVVTDSYFDALGIPLRQGRRFGAQDAFGAPRVVIVNEALAERAWPDESPIGQRIKPHSMEAWFSDGDAPWLTVVGVVGDVRHHGFDSDVRPELFVALRQVPAWARQMTTLVKAEADAEALAATALRTTARQADPGLAVEVSALADRLRDTLAERRLITSLLGSFSTAGLLLACLGIYGLVSFAASERTREMAIRTALGARRSGLLRLMIRGAGKVLGIGVAIGLVLAYLLSDVMDALVVEISTSDPAAYLLSAGTLVITGIIAAGLPSWRASKSDPIRALNDT